MAANSLTWTWDDFSGGEADGFKKGPQGSVRVTENVDCRRNDGGVYLSDDYSFYKDYVGGVTAVSNVNSTTSPEPSFTTFDGSIGRLYSGSNTPLVISDSTSYGKHVIALAGKYWTGTNPGASGPELNIYAISSTSGNSFRIHRITPDYLTITYGIAQGTLPNRSPALGGVKSAAVYDDFNRLLIGIGNGIYELTQSEVLTLKISFRPDIEIKGITKFQDSYRVYYCTSSLISGTSDSFIGYWDGQSNELSQIARYDNSSIISVIGGDAYDYVTFGRGIVKGSDLYAVGGLVRNKLRVTHSETVGDTREFTKGGVYKDGILYLPGKNKNGNYCLYEYGAFFRGQNESLCAGTKSIELVGTNVPISACAFYNIKKYVWIDTGYQTGGKVLEKTLVYGGATVDSGEIITFPFYGIGAHTLKRLDKIRVGFNIRHNINSGITGKIKILARVDGYDGMSNISGFVELAEFKESSFLSGEILSSTINEKIPSKWNSIEFKIVLIKGGAETSFRSIEIEYTDNLYN